MCNSFYLHWCNTIKKLQNKKSKQNLNSNNATKQDSTVEKTMKSDNVTVQ